MTTFVPIALFLLIAAMLFVLPALLRDQTSKAGQSEEVNLAVLRDQLRELDSDLANGVIDQASFAVAKSDVEKRIAENGALQRSASPGRHQSVAAIVIGLSVPVVAVSLYFLIGTPNALTGGEVTAMSNQTAAAAGGLSSIEALEQNVKNKPDDPEAWDRLANAYHQAGKYREAAAAYVQLIRLVPDNADVLADYADTVAMAQNKTLQGEPEKIIARALSIDPKNIKALALSGSAAFERRDYQSAIAQWKKILPLVEAQSEVARAITGNISEAETMAGAPVSAVTQVATAGAAKATAPAVSGTSLQGVVQLGSGLLNKADPNATVFIFARAEQGPRFPLAVLRKQVKDLPVNFTLDDTMGMMPNVKLSDYPSVVVGARISKSGSATPEAGDLEGLSAPVRPGTSGLKIVIDKVRN